MPVDTEQVSKGDTYNMGLFADATNAVLGGLGAVEGFFNLGSQNSNLKYQRELQERIFQREDTAYQRAAADLAQAGLSKTLAAGSGSASGSVVNTSAPQSDTFGRMAQAMNLNQVAATTKKIESETANNILQGDLIKAQIPSELYRQNLMKAQEALITGQTSFLGVQTEQVKATIRKIETEIDEKLKRMGYTEAQIKFVDAQTKKLGYDTDLVISAIDKTAAETGKINTETQQLKDMFSLKQKLAQQELASYLLDNQMKGMENWYTDSFGLKIGTASQSAFGKLASDISNGMNAVTNRRWSFDTLMKIGM